MDSKATTMKDIMSLFVLLLILLMPEFTKAQQTVTYTDTVSFTKNDTNPHTAYINHRVGDVNKLEESGDFVMWKHHLNYRIPPARILKGTLTVRLKDDSDIPLEYVFLFSEDFEFDFDKFSEVFKYDVITAYLEDRVFKVKLLSLMGDFYIVQSELTVEYVPK